jgi:signal peptidase
MSAQGVAARSGDPDALAAARRDAVKASRSRARPRRTRAHAVRDGIITLAGLAGLVVIAWTVLSRVLGLSLVVLMTGSMAPTMPTGSAAVLLDGVPAAELRAGDVVKVPRPGYELPVTHRIVAVGPVTGEVERLSVGVDPADPAARQLVLQGDANASVDPLPYVVTEADRVLVAAPYLGYANRLLHTPIVLAGLIGTVLLVLVGTSLPSADRRGGGRDAGRRAGRHAEPQASAREPQAPVTEPLPLRPRGRSRRPSGRGR